MKHMLSIAVAAVLACGLVGAPASAGDGCNSCDTCGSGKKSFFSGGFFSKKSCGGCDSCATPVVQSNPCDCSDPCGKKWKFSGFKFFGKNDCNTCCDSAPVVRHDDCNSCDPCGKKWSLPKGKWFKGGDCGCDDPCARRLSLPKINFFKRGCGCDTGCDPCGGNGVVYGGHAQGGVITHSAPAASGGLAPVPGTTIQSAPAHGTHIHAAPVPGTQIRVGPAGSAPAGAPVQPVHPAPVPVPAGS